MALVLFENSQNTTKVANMKR